MRSTLKNFPTLISSEPCRDVVDAYFRRRLFPVFLILLLNITGARSAEIFYSSNASDAQKNGRCLKTSRRLFNSDPAEKWSMLISDDGNYAPTSMILNGVRFVRSRAVLPNVFISGREGDAPARGTPCSICAVGLAESHERHPMFDVRS